MPSQCDRCTDKGKLCCSYLMLQLAAPLSGDHTRWVEMHSGITIVELDGATFVRIDTPCGHLTEDGLCDIYGRPERPRLCREWPQYPEWQAPEGCVFLDEFRLNTVLEPSKKSIMPDPFHELDFES